MSRLSQFPIKLRLAQLQHRVQLLAELFKFAIRSPVARAPHARR